MRFFRTFNAGAQPFRVQSLASAQAERDAVLTNPTIQPSESSAQAAAGPREEASP